MKETLTRAQKIQYAIRIFLILFIIGVFAVVLCMYAPDVLRLLRSGDQAAMEAYISEAEDTGVYILVLLQVLQTITIFFPGIPIYMCAGIIYGNLLGTLICYITYVVTNCLVFVMARRMKQSAEALIDFKKNSKIEDLMKKTTHPVALVAILCIFPVVPNGIIPYIAERAGISFKNFFTAVAFGCIPGIFLFVCCGDLLMSKFFWVIIVGMFVILFAVILGFIFKKQVSAFAEKMMEKIAGTK